MRTLLFLTLVAGLSLTQAVPDQAPARPAVGDAAPALRLNDQHGQAVTVAPPAQGTDGAWTVLAFYPKAATPG